MRKIKTMLIGLFLIAWGMTTLAQDKLPGLVRTGQYQPGTLDSITQPNPSQPPNSAEYSVGDYPLYTSELAPGEGQALVNTYCQVCHSVTYITMQPPLSAAAWEATVNKMINTYGAYIPEDAAKQIIAYLQAHYRPETRKK
ncbi:MAG: cytochrome c [Acidobacteria bacterium]|nr:cytochrome c [Acidobacteriota bacterium]